MISPVEPTLLSSVVKLTGLTSMLAFTAFAFQRTTLAAANPNAAPPSIGAGAKAETDTYLAEIKASGGYKAGAEGTVLVTFAPKSGYHINDQVPYKFKATAPAPEGVTYPKPVLVRADGKFEEKQGTFTVPFTVSKPGKTIVSGTLHLSVCSPANCIVDKVSLEIPVEVK